MKRSVRRLGMVSFLAVIVSCGNDARVAGKPTAPPAEKDAALATASRGFAAAAPEPGQPALPDRASDSLVPSMIIRTGQAEVTVDSLEVAIRKVEELAGRVGGFVGNSSVQSGEGQRRQATLQLKVPAGRYAQALSGLAGIGKLVSSTTEAQDVGEEYVDVTARMSNARRLEERLLALLAMRTGKLQDVLAVEQELARVREEIERFDGRQRYLRANVAVSTLSVTLAEPGPVVGEPGSNVIVEALKQAWRNLVTFVANLIASLGTLVPLFLLILLGFFAWRRWVRKPVAPPPPVQ